MGATEATPQGHIVVVAVAAVAAQARHLLSACLGRGQDSRGGGTTGAAGAIVVQVMDATCAHNLYALWDWEGRAVVLATEDTRTCAGHPEC